MERDKGTRRMIHLRMAREKTSETPATSGKSLAKAVQDVSGDFSPQLHDPSRPAT